MTMTMTMTYGPRTLASLLPPNGREEVLRRFTNRFTCDHVPAWACKKQPDGSYPAPQFATDEEWLSNTIVRTRKDGQLDLRPSTGKTSGETWPLGKTLDQPYTKKDTSQ